MNKLEKSFPGDNKEDNKPVELEESSDGLIIAEEKSEEDINPDEIFEKTRLELEEKEEIVELQNKVDKWLENQTPKIRERLIGFGASEEEIDDFIKRMNRDLTSKIRFIGSELDSMKDDLKKIRPRLKETEEVQSIADWLELASRPTILKLLNRKFEGESSDWEKQILILMNEVKHKGVGGTHHPILEELDISLFNEKGFKEWNGVLDHELTHHGLGLAAPEAAYVQLTAQKSLKKHERPSKVVAFAGLLSAINESAAHLVEGRYPDVDSYADRVSPRIFDRVYRLMEKAVKDKNLKDRDIFFTHVYSSVAKEWRDDMTSKDIAELIFNLEKFFK